VQPPQPAISHRLDHGSFVFQSCDDDVGRLARRLFGGIEPPGDVAGLAGNATSPKVSVSWFPRASVAEGGTGLDIAGCRSHHSWVRSFKSFRRAAAWDPTPAQREAALRLAVSISYVRTDEKGTTDLRTIENNGLRRYMIARSGELELVESGDALGGFFWSDCLGATAMLLMVASVGAALFVSDGLAVAVCFACFMTFLGHLALFARTFLRAVHPGNERWDRVGGPEE
jgi:hypothetical protein